MLITFLCSLQNCKQLEQFLRRDRDSDWSLTGRPRMCIVTWDPLSKCHPLHCLTQTMMKYKPMREEWSVLETLSHPPLSPERPAGRRDIFCLLSSPGPTRSQCGTAGSHCPLTGCWAGQGTVGWCSFITVQGASTTSLRPSYAILIWNGTNFENVPLWKRTVQVCSSHTTIEIDMIHFSARLVQF